MHCNQFFKLFESFRDVFTYLWSPCCTVVKFSLYSFIQVQLWWKQSNRVQICSWNQPVLVIQGKVSCSWTQQGPWWDSNSHLTNNSTNTKPATPCLNHLLGWS